MAEPIRALLIDDEDSLRDLLRLRLERAGGFDIVGEGASAQDAVALCAAHQPHVIVLDACLPDDSGLSAVPEIRRAAPDTVVVIYTSESGTATRDEAELAGAHAVVGKLDSIELLIGTIHRLVPGHAPPLDPTSAERAAFGQQMTALLDEAPAEAEAARRGRRQSRTWMIVLLVLVTLPLLAAAAWLIAQLAGFGLG